MPLTGVIQHGLLVTEEYPEEDDNAATPESEAAQHRESSLLSRVRILILLIIGAAFLVVATANRQSVIIDLIVKKIEASLSLTLILTFFCGTIAGLFLAYFRPWRKRD